MQGDIITPAMRFPFSAIKTCGARAALLAATISCAACAAVRPSETRPDGPSAPWRAAVTDAEALLFSSPYSRSSPKAAAHTRDFLAGLMDSAWRASGLRTHPYSVSLIKAWYIVGSPGLVNPDNQYFSAILDPEAGYLIEGVRGTHTELYLQLLSEDPQLEVGKGLQVLDDKVLNLRPGRPFRIYLGGARRSGRWFPLPAEAKSLLVRQTFSDWENERPTLISLRRLDTTPPERTHAAEGRFALAAKYLRRGVELWAQVFPQRVAARPPNRINLPQRMGEGLQSQQGANFHYRITPEQALVVTVRRSAAPYQAIQVGTPWFVTPDFVHHQSSLNQHQAHLDPDGSFRFILSLKDPGLQNWLDPDGEAEGASYMRWQGLERPLSEAEYPRIDLVDYAELEDWLRRAGSTMPRVSMPRPPRYNAPALK